MYPQISSASSLGSTASASASQQNLTNGKGMTLAGLGRIHTDLHLGRQLKYERFDPPALAGVPRNPFAEPPATTQNQRSPDIEGPKPLDLDLLSDMQDVIFRVGDKPEQGAGPSAPPINRQVSNCFPCCPARDRQPPAPHCAILCTILYLPLSVLLKLKPSLRRTLATSADSSSAPPSAAGPTSSYENLYEDAGGVRRAGDPFDTDHLHAAMPSSQKPRRQTNNDVSTPYSSQHPVERFVVASATATASCEVMRPQARKDARSAS